MVRDVVLLLLVGCGRFGFGEHGDPADTLGTVDTTAGFPAGLVSWFPLDDASATNFADVVSGFGGTCNGTQCPIPTAGHRGNAFKFDGNDDCLEVANMGQFGPQITHSVWFRQDANDLCSIVAKPAYSVSATADTWQLETSMLNAVSFVSSHGTTSNHRINTPDNTLAMSTWTHFAVTYDGAIKRLYLDGVEVANGAIATPLTYDVQNMFIGCDNNSGTLVERCNGAIDELQVYNRALTPTEIQMLAAR